MSILQYFPICCRGAFQCGVGPLDAQCRLLDHILEQNYDQVDISNAISVIQSISMLVHHHILAQEKVSCKSASETSVNARSCFGGLFASMLRAGDAKSMSGEANRDVLMCSLLKLVNMLVQISLPPRNNPTRRIGNPNPTVVFADFTPDAPSSGQLDERSVPDSSKIRDQNAAAAPPTLQELPKSDEEKGSETDEQKTETAAAAAGGASQKKPRSCTHFVDMKNPATTQKEPCLADIILTHDEIMANMIQALSCCNSNTMAMILGSSGLQGNMQDSFTGIDPLSVGDGVFQILCTLNRKASELRLMLQPIFSYLNLGFHGSRPSICRLSEPLLWLILRVLDCEAAIRIFLDMGKAFWK